MKKIIILITFSLIAGFVPANAQNIKVAFVDSEVIIKQLPETQVITRQMEDLQRLYVDTLTAMENEIKSKADAYKMKYEDAEKKISAGQMNQDQIKAIDEELKGIQDEVSRMQENLYTYRQGIQQNLLAKQQELFKPVREKIEKQIEAVAKEMKFQFVFDKAADALLYGDKKFDITFDVLKKLN